MVKKYLATFLDKVVTQNSGHSCLFLILVQFYSIVVLKSYKLSNYKSHLLSACKLEIIESILA